MKKLLQMVRMSDVVKQKIKIEKSVYSPNVITFKTSG
jgi:hypothetical protein